MNEVMEIRNEDMYGNTIFRLGETGYGVSMALHSPGQAAWLPLFTFFHVSDGFRQALFCCSIDHGERPVSLGNIFHDRIGELLSSNPHGVYV